jgi:hypothetical protein
MILYLDPPPRCIYRQDRPVVVKEGIACSTLLYSTYYTILSFTLYRCYPSSLLEFFLTRALSHSVSFDPINIAPRLPHFRILANLATKKPRLRCSQQTGPEGEGAETADQINPQWSAWHEARWSAQKAERRKT